MQLNIIFIIIGQIVINSPDQHYCAVIDYYPGTELAVRSITLKHDNNTCYVKDLPGGATYYVNDNGYVFGISNEALFVYDQQGREIRLLDLDAPNGFGFSPDHSIFFTSDITGLRAYEQDGTLKYIFPACRIFAGSDTANIVATVTSESLFIYDSGEEVYTTGLYSPYVWSIELREEDNAVRLEYSTGIQDYFYKEKAGEK